jgi:hypothetical protein
MRDLLPRLERLERKMLLIPSPDQVELTLLARHMMFEEIEALQAIAAAAGRNVPPYDDPVVLAVAQAARCRQAGHLVASLFGQG